MTPIPYNRDMLAGLRVAARNGMTAEQYAPQIGWTVSSLLSVAKRNCIEIRSIPGSQKPAAGEVPLAAPPVPQRRAPLPSYENQSVAEFRYPLSLTVDFNTGWLRRGEMQVTVRPAAARLLAQLAFDFPAAPERIELVEGLEPSLRNPDATFSQRLGALRDALPNIGLGIAAGDHRIGLRILKPLPLPAEAAE